MLLFFIIQLALEYSFELLAANVERLHSSPATASEGARFDAKFSARPGRGGSTVPEDGVGRSEQAIYIEGNRHC